MDFYSDCKIGMMLNKVALSPSRLPQLNINFEFVFKSKYRRFVQHQDDPTSLRFLEPFRRSTSLKTSARVAVGESLSFEDIRGAVREAIGDRLPRGDRNDLMILASAEVRRYFPTETLRRNKDLILSFEVWILYRRVHVIESEGPRMVPAVDSSFALLDECEVGRDEKEKACCICMEELAGGRHGGRALRMPCSHVFHGVCIEEWLRTSHYCPLCRYEMPT